MNFHANIGIDPFKILLFILALFIFTENILSDIHLCFFCSFNCKRGILLVGAELNMNEILKQSQYLNKILN